MRAFFGTLLIAGAIASFNATAADRIPAGYKVVYEQKFEKPEATNDFLFSDPKAWTVTKDDHGGALELIKQSDYKPPFRSPFNIALIKGKAFSDFIVEADVIQTGKEYGHRDMCFFFGYQSPEHFYYSHIATAADDHAHNIFNVKDAARLKIAEETTKGVNWGLNVWHHVRLVRNGTEGTVQVFFDDMEKPIQVAHDKTFSTGSIGFGSFDDTGKVANIKVWAKEVKEQTGTLFAPKL